MSTSHLILSSSIRLENKYFIIYSGFDFFKTSQIFFWRCFDIKQELPINGQISEKEVQVIDENGQKLGVYPIQKALDTAFEKDLDLVLVAPNANPPVCKIMNYGKYKFEQAKKEKESRKNQKVVEVKEIRGRELNNIKAGEEVLNKIIEALEDVANVEKKPFLEGKTMFIILTKKI